MIKTLKESKAILSSLVERASQGEEVIITVRGKPKARLCPLVESPAETASDRHQWLSHLREARAKYSTGTHDTSTEILEQQRGDRV